MPRNRFQSIIRYLHCSDNQTVIPRGQAGYDPLHKISPVVDFFNEVFEKNYRLDTFNRKREHTFMNIPTPNLK
jgi:hypothetical protein